MATPDLSKLPYGQRRKLQSAIDRVRWWLCGQHGLHAVAIKDHHVAAEVRDAKDDDLLNLHHGLGIDGLALLRKWAKRISKGQAGTPAN
jgi:hypothetical protein